MCRPSRENGIHDGYDRRKQAVKLADVFDIEKVWAAIYEANHKKVILTKMKSCKKVSIMRDEKFRSTLVERA